MSELCKPCLDAGRQQVAHRITDAGVYKCRWCWRGAPHRTQASGFQTVMEIVDNKEEEPMPARRRSDINVRELRADRAAGTTWRELCVKYKASQGLLARLAKQGIPTAVATAAPAGKWAAVVAELERRRAALDQAIATLKEL